MKRFIVGILLFLIFISSEATEKKRFTKSIKVPPGKHIELTSEVGLDVKMQSWDKDSVYIDLYVRIKSSEKEYEKIYIEEFEIDVWENSSEVEITIEDTDESLTTSFWDIISFNFVKSVDVEIKGEIFVPNKNGIIAKVKYSEIKLRDMTEEITIEGKGNELTFENCPKLKKVKNEYGNISLFQTGGDDLLVQSRSSKVSVEKHAGNIFIDASYSNISANQIEGSLKVNGRSGEVQIAGVTGDLTVNADYTNFEIEGIKGRSSVITHSSTAKIKNVGFIKFVGPYSNLNLNGVINADKSSSSYIENRSGKIYLSNINSSIEIEDDYSDIKLRDIVGDVKLSSRSNDITCNNLHGNWSSNTEYCRIDLRKMNSEKVFVKNRSGKIELDLINVPAEVKIENQYESISVRVPSNYKGRYELECKYGEIQTDFEHNKFKGKKTSMISGEIGQSSNTLKIKSRSGDISLQKKDSTF